MSMCLVGRSCVAAAAATGTPAPSATGSPSALADARLGRLAPRGVGTCEVPEDSRDGPAQVETAAIARAVQPLARCVDAESVGVPHVLGARVWVATPPRRCAMRGLLRMGAKCQLSSARQRLLRV